MNSKCEEILILGTNERICQTTKYKDQFFMIQGNKAKDVLPVMKSDCILHTLLLRSFDKAIFHFLCTLHENCVTRNVQLTTIFAAM